MTDRPSPHSGTASLIIFSVVFVLVFMLIVITTTLVTFILPEAYESTARIKVDANPAGSPLSRPAQATSGPSALPNFVQTTCEIIQSEIVLRKVVEAMDLNVEWGKKYAAGDPLKISESLQLLRGRLEVRPVRNTSLIEIRGLSEKPEEAASLANGVTRAYVEYVKSASDGTQVEVVDTGFPGLRPVRPNKPLNIGLGIVVGVLLGSACGALAVWFGRLYQRMKLRDAAPK